MGPHSAGAIARGGPVAAASSSASARRVALVLGAVALCVFLVHRSTLGSFLFEDDVQLIMDGRVLGWTDTWRLDGRVHFFRPLVETYFVLGGRLDLSPAALHLVNVLLHIGNSLLVFGLARQLSSSHGRGFAPNPGAPGRSSAQANRLPALAAILFAAQSRTVESVAWIAGISAVLLTTWVLLCAICWLTALTQMERTGRAAWQTPSWWGGLVTFVLALGTHEASVMLLPILVLLWWTRLSSPRVDRARPRPPGARRRQLLALAPHLVLLGGFLLVSVVVNRRNYVVTEGHYQIGWHAFANVMRYLVSLYVGRSDGWSMALTLLAFAAAAIAGRTAVRVGALWTLVTILPYAFFTWPTTARYLYLPAAGFALLLAGLIVTAGQRLERTASWRHAGAALTWGLAGIVAARFLVFGATAADDMRQRAEDYRSFVAEVRAAHPSLPSSGVLEVTLAAPTDPGSIYVEPLLRWAYGNPALPVVVHETR